MDGWGAKDDDVLAAFEGVCDRMLDEHPGDGYGRMFGANGLKLGNGKFYCFCPGDAVVAKLPAAEVSRLIDEGTGGPCAPSGRVMKEWIRLTGATGDDLLGLVRDARTFVVEVTGG